MQHHGAARVAYYAFLLTSLTPFSWTPTSDVSDYNLSLALSLSLSLVGMQLLECQQELAQVREEKCFATQMVRDTEEALEQAVQHERRAMAEVELLR